MQAMSTPAPSNGRQIDPELDRMITGNPDRYAPTATPVPGRFMHIGGRPSAPAYARLIEHMQKAAAHLRLAQNAAVAAGIAGSELEALLDERADAAEALFARVKPALFLQAQ